MRYCQPVPLSREVATRICEELTECDFGTPPDADATENLLNLALASRQMFLEAALDEMWREQASLMPLLLRLPGVTIDGRMSNKQPLDLIFARGLRPTDWSRFLFYASRVQTLILSYDEHDFPSPDTWTMLIASRPIEVNHLLPNLQVLTAPAFNTTFHFVRLLCPPSLKTLNIRFCDDRPSPSTLATLAALYPTLKKLIIRQASDKNVTDIGRVLQRSSSTLRCLNLTHVDQPTFERITRLPSLTGFALHHLDEIHVTPLFQARPERNIFPSLRHLTLGNVRLTQITRFLQSISHTTLEALVLKSVGSSGLGTWDSFLTALRPFSNSLLCFSMQEDSRTIYKIGSEALQPLFAMKHLTIVELNSGGRLEIDDEVLEELAVAWPCLTQLFLKGKHPDGPPKTSPTLAGLLPLVRSCPWLRKVELYINANIITPDMVDQRPGSGLNNVHIRKLGVFNSPLNNPNTVFAAAYLSALFPNLTSIYTSEEVSPDRASRWKEVERHLQVAKTILQWRP